MADPDSKRANSVLVVDDNQDICAFMQAALETAGYDVRIAAEGAQALALLRSRPADLMITDIFMPVREGIETISQCKTEFPQTRIIAMTAGGITGKRDFLSAATLIGADATLRKPFAADQLLDAVRKVLR
jgi:CheY-like chemotaxis protein